MEGAFVLLLAKVVYHYACRLHGMVVLTRLVKARATSSGGMHSGVLESMEESDNSVNSIHGGHNHLQGSSSQRNGGNSRSAVLSNRSRVGRVGNIAQPSFHQNSVLPNDNAVERIGFATPFRIHGMGIVMYGVGIVLLPIPNLLRITLYGIAMPVVFPTFYLMSVLFAILGDASYRKMTGNVTPPPSVLQTGFGDVQVRMHVTDQLTSKLLLTRHSTTLRQMCRHNLRTTH